MYFRPQLLVLCKLNEDLKPKTDNLFAFVGQLKAGKHFYDWVVLKLKAGNDKDLWNERFNVFCKLSHTLTHAHTTLFQVFNLAV